MPNIIDRSAAEALIQEQVQNSIEQDAPQNSIFMQLARRLPNMTSNRTRIPVLDLLPMAYWVNGDTGYKQTSQQAWDNVFLDAGELAVIVPIPEAVLEDAEFDIMGQVTPRVMEAIGEKVDSACIFDVDRPANWRAGILTTARQAGNNVAPGNTPDYYDLLLGEGGVISKVEESGRMVTAAIAAMGMRAKLRGIRGEDGHPIFKSDMQGATQYALDGAPMFFPQNGCFDLTRAQLIVGDFSRAVYSIRKDVTVKILTEGVIQDPGTKAIVYNLAQQDMIALRVVFRMGWALPNPAIRMDGDRTGCPFAYLEPATPVTTRNFTATVQTGTGNDAEAVPGAFVTVSGARKKVNASGVAVFTLEDGTYDVIVKAKGYAPLHETVTISGSAVSKTFTLVEA